MVISLRLSIILLPLLKQTKGQKLMKLYFHSQSHSLSYWQITVCSAVIFSLFLWCYFYILYTDYITNLTVIQDFLIGWLEMVCPNHPLFQVGTSCRSGLQSLPATNVRGRSGRSKPLRRPTRHWPHLISAKPHGGRSTSGRHYGQPLVRRLQSIRSSGSSGRLHHFGLSHGCFIH